MGGAKPSSSVSQANSVSGRWLKPLLLSTHYANKMLISFVDRFIVDNVTFVATEGLSGVLAWSSLI